MYFVLCLLPWDFVFGQTCRTSQATTGTVRGAFVSRVTCWWCLLSVNSPLPSPLHLTCCSSVCLGSAVRPNTVLDRLLVASPRTCRAQEQDSAFFSYDLSRRSIFIFAGGPSVQHGQPHFSALRVRDQGADMRRPDQARVAE